LAHRGAVECGLLTGFGEELGSGWRVGEAGGVVDHAAPGFVGIDEGMFFFGEGQGVEHDLAEVGQGGGGALRDAVLSQGGEYFAEDVVDVGGGKEIAGEGGGDFRSQFGTFQELLLVAGMEGAESGMRFHSEHAALAVVGEGVLAKVGAGGAGCGHWSVILPFRKKEFHHGGRRVHRDGEAK